MIPCQLDIHLVVDSSTVCLVVSMGTKLACVLSVTASVALVTTRTLSVLCGTDCTVVFAESGVRPRLTIAKV